MAVGSAAETKEFSEILTDQPPTSRYHRPKRDKNQNHHTLPSKVRTVLPASYKNRKHVLQVVGTVDERREPQSEQGVAESTLCGLQVHESSLILGYNMKHAGG